MQFTRTANPALRLGAYLDRWCAFLDGQGRPHAAITLTAQQFEAAHRLLHYELLSGGRLEWRGHPLRLAAK